jgi:arylsulfatase A-like enzyme
LIIQCPIQLDFLGNLMFTPYRHYRFIITTLLLMVTGSSYAQGTPPNVIVLFSDQHRMADFPGEPHTSVIAPNLDRLSKQGVRFQHAISNYPVCSPFRAILLTGHAPYRTGVIDNLEHMKNPEATMAHAFKKAGYHTGYIGKWHLQFQQDSHLKPFGFNESRIWADTNSHYHSRYFVPEKKEWVNYTDFYMSPITHRIPIFMMPRRSIAIIFWTEN